LVQSHHAYVATIVAMSRSWLWRTQSPGAAHHLPDASQRPKQRPAGKQPVLVGADHGSKLPTWVGRAKNMCWYCSVGTVWWLALARCVHTRPEELAPIPSVLCSCSSSHGQGLVWGTQRLAVQHLSVYPRVASAGGVPNLARHTRRAAAPVFVVVGGHSRRGRALAAGDCGVGLTSAASPVECHTGFGGCPWGLCDSGCVRRRCSLVIGPDHFSVDES
jgi:hypothetical protein